MATAATAPLILRVLSSSVKVINRAGKIIRDVMNKGNLGIVEKGINDLQTEADRSAQRCIVSSLTRQFPKIEIIGEETLDPQEKDVEDDFIVSDYDSEVLKSKCPDELKSIVDEDVVIWVDPVDGTSEYTQGLLDHVTVLIGISVHGKAVGGVIHQPFFNYKANDPTQLGRTIWGLVGLGAFGFTHHLPPTNKRIITTTRSHSTPEVQAALDAMEADEILRVGGAGHKVLLLLEGKAHAYVFASPGCKKWDTCAPEAVLKCVGGWLTDVHGNELEYHKNVKHRNSGGVLAVYDKEVHSWYCTRIPDAVRNLLKP
uniref:3'(2'),5'-bisphosphate nucleotidase 1 n=1 Tax=Hemiscolopendra marginata TaxID=943146 RepID=A0A646QJE7_9MYRI